MESDAALPLRLALSHREKANALLAETEAAFSRGLVDQTQLNAQRERYLHEQIAANTEIARYRKLAEAHGETLRAELRACRHEQAHLPDRVSAGKLLPEQANDRNRVLAQRIEMLREELRNIETAVTAESPKDLGGFVDLPFDGYQQQILSLTSAAPKGTGGDAQLGPKRWELIAAIAVAAVCSISIFLPWVVYRGVSVSLLHTGLDFGPGEANHLARLAWVAYVIVPWLAVVFLLRVSGPARGWSVLGTGILLLAAALVPVVLAGADRVHAEDIRQLFSALHVGPVVYAIAALLLIVIGSLRVSPWGDSLAHAATVSLSLVGVVAVIAGLFALVLFFGPEPGSVRFEATMRETGDAMRVICRNRGRDTIRVAVPWPEDGAEAIESLGDGPLYGIRVEIRETGADDFCVLPYSQQPWSRPRIPFLEGPAVEVRPGIDQELILDLRQISVVGADAEAVRLVFIRPGGSEADRFETPLSGQYLSPSAESREPYFLPKPNTAPAPTHDHSEQPPGAESESESIERVISRGWLSFTGIVGEKIAIEVWDSAGNSSGTRLIQPGEAIAEGWYLESVTSSPASIIVHHDPSGTQTSLPRGERMSLGSMAAPAQ